MTIEGMTLPQYGEVLQYIIMYHKHPNGLSIKYVDTTYDIRFHEITSITFKKRSCEGIILSINHFSGQDHMPEGWKYTNLYDWSMAYLKGEFKPTHEFYIDKG